MHNQGHDDRVAAIDFIPADNANIATADTPYVYDGPNVQYEAHAVHFKLTSSQLIWKTNLPSRGPIARPSWPDDLK